MRTKTLVALAVASPLIVAGCTAAPEHERLSPPTELELGIVSPDAALEEFRSSLEQGVKARNPGIELPEVETVRFILPEEWAQTMRGCLATEGFIVTETPDGGISYSEIPGEQAVSLEIANYVCALKYPVDPRYTQDLTDYQLRYLFEYFIFDLVPCLRERGQQIAEPPSLQQFLETWDTEEAWSPYRDVEPGSESDWYALNAACPQNPENLFG